MMNRTFAAAILGGGLLAAALGLAGTASADPDWHGSKGDNSAAAYAVDMQADGVTMTDNEALTIAHAVCVKRAAGITEHALIEQLDAARPNHLQAVSDTVLGAEFHFCPQYYG